MERGLSNNFGQTNVYYRNLTPKQAALPKLARGQEGSECDSPKVPNHNLTSSLSPPDPVKATTRILRLWLRRRGRGGEKQQKREEERRARRAGKTGLSQCRGPHLAMSPFSSVPRKMALEKGGLLDTLRERLGPKFLDTDPHRSLCDQKGVCSSQHTGGVPAPGGLAREGSTTVHTSKLEITFSELRKGLPESSACLAPLMSCRQNPQMYPACYYRFSPSTV